VAPYFDLPSTGNDNYGRAGRGYVEGRFRGERLVYGEMEYRGTLTANGLLGMVAFLNLTTVSDQEAGQPLFHDVAPGAGVGLRVQMNKRARTNICIDVGVGRQGSKGLYLGLQEVF
jgi:hemolysin activation/secretion protein